MDDTEATEAFIVTYESVMTRGTPPHPRSPRKKKKKQRSRQEGNDLGPFSRIEDILFTPPLRGVYNMAVSGESTPHERPRSMRSSGRVPDCVAGEAHDEASPTEGADEE